MYEPKVGFRIKSEILEIAANTKAGKNLMSGPVVCSDLFLDQNGSATSPVGE